MHHAVKAVMAAVSCNGAELGPDGAKAISTALEKAGYVVVRRRDLEQASACMQVIDERMQKKKSRQPRKQQQLS